MIALPQISGLFPHTVLRDWQTGTDRSVTGESITKQQFLINKQRMVGILCVCSRNVYILAQNIPYLVSLTVKQQFFFFFILVNFWKTKPRKGLWVSGNALLFREMVFDRRQRYCCMLTFNVLCECVCVFVCHLWSQTKPTHSSHLNPQHLMWLFVSFIFSLFLFQFTALLMNSWL